MATTKKNVKTVDEDAEARINKAYAEAAMKAQKPTAQKKANPPKKK